MVRKKVKTQSRAAPGSRGAGDYYHINIRPKEEFVSFKMHDVGEKGHLIRLAGERSDGSWDTQAWLVGKTDAHLQGETLVPDSRDAAELFSKEFLDSPKHLEGDIYRAELKKH